MASSASIRALSRRSMASQRSPVAGEMSVLCALHTAATSKNRLRFFSEASSQAYTSRSSAPLVRRTRYLYSSPSMSVMVGVSVWRSNMYTFRVLPILYSHRHKNTSSVFTFFFEKVHFFWNPGKYGSRTKLRRAKGNKNIRASKPGYHPGRISGTGAGQDTERFGQFHLPSSLRG